MQDAIKESEHKMQSAMDVLKRNFAAVRSGRANPSLLDHVKVSYYGTDVPLRQLAQISVPEPRQMIITPFDKNAAKDIEKAIMTADLGISPKREATVIRLFLPEPSEERRKELVKVIKKETEDAKIAIRNVRREAIDSLKKQKGDKKITEDDEKVKDKKVQDLTDKYCNEAEALFSAKEKEIMEV
ncbi:MAG: ribosome recycling factor [bacterium]